MRLLFRTYVHSKRATVVSLASGALTVLLALGAAANMILGIYTDGWSWVLGSVVCVVSGVLCFYAGGRLSDYLAIRDLEKKLGKPIIGIH